MMKNSHLPNAYVDGKLEPHDMTEKTMGPAFGPAENLANRRVSMVDFPWRDMPASRIGHGLLDLIETVLSDGPEASEAFARLFEGAEVLCEFDIRLDAGSIKLLEKPLAALREAAAVDGSVSANEWFLWGVDALQMAVIRPDAQHGLLPYLRTARLAAECFCSGKRLAACHSSPLFTSQNNQYVVN